MTDMSASIAAIQEFFLAQDQTTGARATAACAAYMAAVEMLETNLAARPGDQADLLTYAETAPFLELRDAIAGARQDVVTVNGAVTVRLRKTGTAQTARLFDTVNMVTLDALETATRQVAKIAQGIAALS